MVEALYLARILEAGFGLLSTTVGIVVLLVALRIGPTLTLSSNRRVMYIFVFTAILVVTAELVGVLEAFLTPSTFADVAEEFAELIAISSGAFALYLIHRGEQEEISALRRSANVDELTNLSSRSFFRRAATRRVELSINNDLPLVCVVLDVDDFKLYNDRYGHEAGDKALRCVGRVLRKSARADDLVARYGGEEFVLLMSGEIEEAVEVAERIREEIERKCAPKSEASLSRTLTVSLGLASLSEDTQTLVQLIEAADKEMYSAKRGGKNRVSFSVRP
jgi:diguanylate cyclase (GGDEF)-like protein